VSKYFVEVETETGMACFETTKIVSITLHNEEGHCDGRMEDHSSEFRTATPPRRRKPTLLLAAAKKGVS
jgi:hypothetical protein